jgi:hypothetical protein
MRKAWFGMTSVGSKVSLPIEASGDKRVRRLVELLGVPVSEACDKSVRGRLAMITKLRSARHTEIARSEAGSWLYDVSRHVALGSALRQEYEALADVLNARDALISHSEGTSAQWPDRTSPA